MQRLFQYTVNTHYAMSVDIYQHSPLWSTSINQTICLSPHQTTSGNEQGMSATNDKLLYEAVRDGKREEVKE